MTPIDRPDKDVLVLGAGIIGVCVALHLQKRGKSVLLVDRRAPGEETSYGNAGLIERGLELIAEDPDRAGSLDRFAVVSGVRLFHLDLAAGRRGAAAHGLYYMTGKLSNGETGVIVLRVLHEGMEPRGKLARALDRTRT